MSNVTHTRTPSACWKAHDKLVRILNKRPAAFGYKNSQSGQYSIAALKPVINELLLTEQLTKEEVLIALEKCGMKATPKYLEKVLNRSSWDSEQKERRSKRKRTGMKYISQSDFDAEIVSVCRTLPHDKIDSRIIVRYWDIIGRLGPHDNSIFLSACDLLNSLEREAREKASLGMNIEDGEPYEPDIKTREEYKEWISWG